jgi:hypothetical protein
LPIRAKLADRAFIVSVLTRSRRHHRAAEQVTIGACRLWERHKMSPSETVKAFVDD